MNNKLLVDWTPADFSALEEGVLVARHALEATGLFTDAALAEIIDAHSPTDLSVNTMGVDPGHFDWREGDRNGVSGAELLQLVRRGQLWINCRNMADNHPAFTQLVDELYNELEQGNRKFVAQNRSANLLISSPTAWVPYHVDMPVNMLWHVRGAKRVWVYPHFDTRFASAEVLEKVCSGQWSEDIPYASDFDRYALVYDAEPGQIITWPQLTPHRVCNLEGLNVSLSTEHKNPRARRRINVHTANHLLRNRLGVACGGASVDGPVAHAKQTLARAARFGAKLLGKRKQQFVYPKTFVVDPSSPHGYRLLEGDEATIVAPHLTRESAA